MGTKAVLGVVLISVSSIASANEPVALTQKVFTGTARDNDGKVLYIERHEVFVSEGDRIQSAYTTYERKSGKVIATLKSDFSQSLSTPTHEAENRLNGDRYGVRHVDGALVMYRHPFDEKNEETLTLKSDFAGASLAVAGQGLNYYVQSNLDKIRVDKETAVTLLIPGRLKYYAFKMRVASEQDGVLNIEFTASNFIVRLFVPTLKVQYDTVNRRLVKYDGVSNITDSDGELRNVVITFDYGT